MINLMRLSTQTEQTDRLPFHRLESTHEDIEALIALFQDQNEDKQTLDRRDTYAHKAPHLNEIETHR